MKKKNRVTFKISDLPKKYWQRKRRKVCEIFWAIQSESHTIKIVLVAIFHEQFLFDYIEFWTFPSNLTNSCYSEIFETIYFSINTKNIYHSIVIFSAFDVCMHVCAFDKCAMQKMIVQNHVLISWNHMKTSLLSINKIKMNPSPMVNLFLDERVNQSNYSSAPHS